jgi:hypothetical protein
LSGRTTRRSSRGTTADILTVTVTGNTSCGVTGAFVYGRDCITGKVLPGQRVSVPDLSIAVSVAESAVIVAF